MGEIEQFPPSQRDLDAYIDGELSPEHHARVAKWLSHHPETRRELLELKLRENLLRTAINQAQSHHELHRVGKPIARSHETAGGARLNRAVLWIAFGAGVLLLLYAFAA